MDNVNNTLYIPLYGKAKVSQMGIILEDRTAEKIWAENAVLLGKKSKSKWLAYFMAMRARVFDDWVRKMLAMDSEVLVLDIGCGLDSRVHRVGASGVLWYDLDFPEVIARRRKYYSEDWLTLYLRKHFLWYAQGFNGAKDTRVQLATSDSSDKSLELLEKLYRV